MAFRVFISFVFIACAFLWASSVDSHAQSSSLEQTVPVAPKKETTVDELYARLASETDAKKAKPTERQLREKLTDSGSETINLLMGWADKALIQSNFPRALDILSHVIMLEPDYAEAWNRRSFIYFNQRDFSRSLADIRRTLELNPRHFGALAALAAILQTMEKDRQALEAWYKVLAIYPANEVAQKAVIDLEEKLAGKGA